MNSKENATKTSDRVYAFKGLFMADCIQASCCVLHSFDQFLPVFGHILSGRSTILSRNFFPSTLKASDSAPGRGASPPSRSIFSNRHSPSAFLRERLASVLLRRRVCFADVDMRSEVSGSASPPAKLAALVDSFCCPSSPVFLR